MLRETINGEEIFMEKPSRELNDQDVVRSRRRTLYIYSCEDAVVDWVDVEMYGREAEEKIWGKGRHQVGEVGGVCPCCA